ncbi:MAG: hypothetical protein ACK51G_08275 [Pseudomonadota bacterium]|jgi:hypothetical protein
MGDLNIEKREADAIKAVDMQALAQCIDRCIELEQGAPLRELPLHSCGLYISNKVRSFERALGNHAKAKAAKKRAETEYDVRKAGRDLEFAVQQMRHRVETEEKEGQLFFVDDHVHPPTLISDHIRVPISYRWRERVEDDWQYGNVTFVHEVVVRPDYSAPEPKRKPSAAQQAREREERRFREMEHLRSLALQAVRDHFRGGGAGSAIPNEVKAKTGEDGGLNNFSVKF